MSQRFFTPTRICKTDRLRFESGPGLRTYITRITVIHWNVSIVSVSVASPHNFHQVFVYKSIIRFGQWELLTGRTELWVLCETLIASLQWIIKWWDILSFWWHSWEVAGSLHHTGGLWEQLYHHKHKCQPLLSCCFLGLRPSWAGGLCLHPGNKHKRAHTAD